MKDYVRKAGLCMCLGLNGIYGWGHSSSVSIPDYPIKKGVSGFYAGIVRNSLIVAGGCNFPDIPVAEGGKKKFYKDAFSISLSDTKRNWTQLKDLPFPCAYGGAVSLEDGLVCIGGMNQDSAFTYVYKIDVTSSQCLSLPPLPECMDNMAAACYQNKIYVTGGNHHAGNALYCLDLTNPDKWVTLQCFPGKRRVQPVLLAAEGRLYLAGGFEMDTERNECYLSSSMVVYDIMKDQWTEEIALPPMQDGGIRCLIGGAGCVAEDRYLLFTGGVNYTIFKKAMEGHGPDDYLKRPVGWYRFNDDVLIWDLNTKRWTVKYRVPGMNRAGGVLLYHEGRCYMVGGEVKPGIRTSAVSVITL